MKIFQKNKMLLYFLKLQNYASHLRIDHESTVTPR